MHLPQIAETGTSRIMTEVWYGYNHNLRMQQGESYDQLNMSCDHYPVLTQRRRRGLVRSITNPQGLACKKQLAWVDGSTLYYAGQAVAMQGISLSADAEDCPKQLVSMGSYLVIFPDGIYWNTLDSTDYGLIDNIQTPSGDIALSLCDENFENYDMSSITISETPPPEPTNGQLWIDLSISGQNLKQWSAYTEEWVTVPSTAVKIHASGIGQGFSAGDGVSVRGISYSGDNDQLKEQLNALNGDWILLYADDDNVVITGIIDWTHTQTGGVTVSRTAPKMDYVIESNNRLWGCHFGLVDGQTVNEIYACKLGDFKNWRVYAGLSTDSYAVSVGADGYFTGAITYKNLPHFFKEDVVYQIYGTMPSNYEVVHTEIPGVQHHCALSLVSEGGYLWYKAPMGVCRYDGSGAQYISAALGDVKYMAATAGAFKSKLYLSMKREDMTWEVLTYDMTRGLWCKEDKTNALFWTHTDYDVYMIDEDGKLWSCLGADPDGALEDPLEWETISAPIGYEQAEQKYLSRFNIRMKLTQDSTAELFVMYDSDGQWRRQGVMMRSDGLRTYMLPVRPRRCDHIQWKLTGRGEVEIYSVSKTYEAGSDAT